MVDEVCLTTKTLKLHKKANFVLLSVTVGHIQCSDNVKITLHVTLIAVNTINIIKINTIPYHTGAERQRNSCHQNMMILL